MATGNKDKNLIRAEVLSRRDSLSIEIRRDKGKKIKERLLGLSEFKESLKILFYASFRSEVNTFDLIKHSITENKITALPKVDKENKELVLYEIKDIGELHLGYFGIPEPPADKNRRMDIEEIDMVIVPGAAFDEQCSRLGYGEGFYDKLLSGANNWGLEIRDRALIVALAFEEQIVALIPSQRHDIRMSRIITDKRTIECLP